MKKLLFFTITMLFMSSAAFAQTQKGYVKTKGRLDNDGNLIPGTPLSEVIVKVKDRNEVMSDKKGNFSFPMPYERYYLESVKKTGYVLTDPDILSKQYFFSLNNLVISLETREEQLEERMNINDKIMKAQKEMIDSLRTEVKRLKAENKITEEEYYQRLQEIVDMQNENQKLIEEMVDRYSKIDFDLLDEFDREIKACILSGDLLKAKSMVMSKGDLTERAEDLRKHREANAKEREEIEKRNRKLEKSEALAQKKLEELAKDYYDLFEIYKLEHKNDSAAYYLELRASLDTTNVEWIGNLIVFLSVYTDNHKKIMDLCEHSLQLALKNNNQLWIANSYSNLGSLYFNQGNNEKALEYLNKALGIRVNELGEENVEIAISYRKIGNVLKSKGRYEESYEFYNKALSISLLCDYKEEIANCYNSIGLVYLKQSDYNKAVEYLKKSLKINKETLGEKHPFIAMTYNNLGLVLTKKGDTQEAMECFNYALNINIEILGVNHSSTATVYNNIAKIYYNNKDFNKAIEYYETALNIFLFLYGEQYSDVATVYSNIGVSYINLKNYDKAEEYLNISLGVRRKIYGENNRHTSNSYNNLAKLYYELGDYKEAKENMLRALNIDLMLGGESNEIIAVYYENIADIYCKLLEYDNAITYYNKALILYTSLFGMENSNVAKCYYSMGLLYLDKENFNKSLKYLNKSLSIRKVLYGDEDSRTIKTQNKISEVEQKLQESKKK